MDDALFSSEATFAGKDLAKQIRAVIDQRAKRDITGLKDLDARFSEQITDLKALRKDFFNKDGSLKDNALSRVANLTSRANVARLERLKKAIPDIEDKIRAIKVFEDIQKAS